METETKATKNRLRHACGTAVERFANGQTFPTFYCPKCECPECGEYLPCRKHAAPEAER